MKFPLKPTETSTFVDIVDVNTFHASDWDIDEDNMYPFKNNAQNSRVSVDIIDSPNSFEVEATGKSQNVVDVSTKNPLSLMPSGKDFLKLLPIKVIIIIIYFLCQQDR